MKNIRYIFEAIALWFAFFVFRMMNTDMASNIGGWIGRNIGPRLATSRKARTNLQNSFPAMEDDEITETLEDMWENLGRVVAEYPHLKTIIHENIEVVGEEHLEKIGKDSSFLVFGGHLGNWELMSLYFNYRIDCPVSGVYRAANNRYVEYLLQRCRDPDGKEGYIPKSLSGAKEIIKKIIQKGRVGILIDQKYNQGMPISFFGRPAMTSTSLAQLAQKYDLPILPVQIERIGDECEFRITLHPPFKVDGGNEEEIMLKCNKMLENWITQNPAQWLWLHRRWDSKVLQNEPL